MLQQAAATHDSTWDSGWNALGVPVLRIAGIKKPTPKYAIDSTKIVYKQVTLGVWKPFTVHTVTLRTGSGDGTVVGPSAELVNCQRSPQINLNDAAANSYGAYVTGVSHTGLARSPTVLADAVHFLTDAAMPRPATCPGAAPTQISTRSADDQTAGLDATTITATGPLTALVSDGSGNELGETPDGSPLAADAIPDGSYDAGVNSSTTTLVDDGAYSGTWTATDAGEAQLEVQVQENDATVGTTVSPPVDVQPGAVLHLAVTRPGPLDGLQLQVDDNGDGTIDRTLPFYPAVAGEAGDDLTPPTSQVDVQRYTAPDGTPMAHVTVTADDQGGAGVAEIRYQLNGGGQGGIYTGPLDLPAKGEIAVTAIDAAGNAQTAPTFGVLDDHPSLPFLVTDFQPPPEWS